jgi:hypothetical protein
LKVIEVTGFDDLPCNGAICHSTPCMALPAPYALLKKLHFFTQGILS